ncbi:hypothetical protein ACICHK_01860 [Streptomyces sp. AHU1]|uniref:hypothetical protein n=1 Tax=Streptomyces sp. AHU1 TaxID=3377215 RepID=UPI0038782E53
MLAPERITECPNPLDPGEEMRQRLEDQVPAAPGNVNVNNPPGVYVGSTDHLQIHVCPGSPDHPHTDLVQ